MYALGLHTRAELTKPANFAGIDKGAVTSSGPFSAFSRKWIRSLAPLN
jgi:hypothetical protein